MTTLKNYGISVKDKLKRLTSSNATYQQVLIRYMHERLLYRLSKSRFRENFILKGGALLFAHQRFLARPTIDIDFLGERISRDKEAIVHTFTEILSLTCEYDGVIFDTTDGSIEAEDIILERRYNGVRVYFTGHLDTIVQRLSMDIGFGDIIVPEPADLEYHTLIEGMGEFNIKAYSLETVIAEKFQTMIEKSIANSRMKDFYDVYSILKSGKTDNTSLEIAIHDVMKNRGTKYENNHLLFTDDFRSNSDKHTQWRAFLKKTRITDGPTFEEVMDLIDRRLKPIWESIG